MMHTLSLWYKHGWIRAIDLSLAEQLQQLGEPESVAFMAALTSFQLGQGHPCLELAQLYHNPKTTLNLPPEHAQQESLQACDDPAQVFAAQPQLGHLEQCLTQLQQSAAVNTNNSPLVLVGSRLYLRRYYDYEQRIKNDLKQRMQTQPKVNTLQLQQVLDALFGATDRISWQRTACAMAMRSLFTIVTGGPGTGKTYTVVRLLATLQKLREQPQPLRIRLAAPTGKAAARMTESISTELENLRAIPAVADVLAEGLATEAVTLHRLLGTVANTRQFRHNAHNPLYTDVLIIDEASMVDIEMLAAVVAALPAQARLILLGDKDQLASVEAGAILGQLCEGAEHGHYAPQLAQWLNATAASQIPAEKIDNNGSQWPYLQHTTMFHESRRFDAEKGIGKLAFEVNQQRAEWLQQWLRDSKIMAQQYPEFDNIHALPCSRADAAVIKQLVMDGYAPLQQLISARPTEQTDEALNQWAKAVLTQLGAFQLLTAVREGDWGMHAFNQRVTYWLHADQSQQHGWFIGRPVMVTHNDYGLNLRNGDIGVVLQRGAGEPLRVAFLNPQGDVRWILPSRLTNIDTAYAMTIHKSQGSEFDHTVMVMPPADAPILTKELLYTGITRAKSHFTLIFSQPQLVLKAVQRRVIRNGGLTDA
ncbi:exodeoxyribonuclease V subunit alpha [Pseudidiomarina donghaiensis]|uniref:RecBCD enzyme subunit RecD n=1 Tax=Pseudidiomarina donghaiensis TaxID=519452 RepID=A0A432XIF4_9GAMM|nr:exodeoxyribonuclease V subunit alpha [Pseudidiomarina donghaiensis]RUO48539.1 exodeoxyribonuclease V subunit alpha [Pseudidiomarina donghaiensis]SFV23912.1 DNA helicase/exodeoxyribonuclease V, alpha subunit [Pseudidiomarina donghaiensis]